VAREVERDPPLLHPAGAVLFVEFLAQLVEGAVVFEIGGEGVQFLGVAVEMEEDGAGEEGQEGSNPLVGHQVIEIARVLRPGGGFDNG